MAKIQKPPVMAMRAFSTGSKTEKASKLNITVQWGDQDAFGHLNNVIYLRYFESARINYMLDSGWMSPSEATKPILLEMDIKYRKQVKFPATLTLYTATLETRTKSSVVGTLFMHGDEIVAEAKAVVVSFDYKLQKTTAIPPSVIEYISQVDAHQLPMVKERLAKTFM